MITVPKHTEPKHTLSPEREHNENYTFVFEATLPVFAADDLLVAGTERVEGDVDPTPAEPEEMPQWRDAAVDAFWLTEGAGDEGE